MIAIILAAGMGKRLYPLTENVPKCLLEIGGKPIIEHQVNLLEDCKVDKIFVAVGYRGNQVKERVRNVHFVFNPFYRFTNSIASLWLVLNKIHKLDDLVILNGDILFEHSIIDEVIHSKSEHIIMLLDDRVPYEKADFKLFVERGYVKKMGMTLERDEYSGEYAGVMRVPESKYDVFSSAIQKIVYAGEFNKWYELVVEKFRFATNVIRTKGRYWTEIDSEKDLRNLEIDKI